VIPERSVDGIIHRKVWRKNWPKKKERVSLSESGLHFGHYIGAAADSEYVSYCHALLASIATRQGFAPSCWSRALSCILEKMPGCSLIQKMRAILLMEADFNFTNKELYGSQMLNMRFGYTAEEIYSERWRTAEDGAVAKQLFYDIVRQFRLCASISSIDAANCYDSIAHAIASLIFQALGVPEESIECMLSAI
jgi:hypothetical protein